MLTLDQLGTQFIRVKPVNEISRSGLLVTTAVIQDVMPYRLVYFEVFKFIAIVI